MAMADCRSSSRRAGSTFGVDGETASHVSAIGSPGEAILDCRFQIAELQILDCRFQIAECRLKSGKRRPRFFNLKSKICNLQSQIRSRPVADTNQIHAARPGKILEAAPSGRNTRELFGVAADALTDQIGEAALGIFPELVVVRGFLADHETSAAVAGVKPFAGRHRGSAGAVEA